MLLETDIVIRSGANLVQDLVLSIYFSSDFSWNNLTEYSLSYLPHVPSSYTEINVVVAQGAALQTQEPQTKELIYWFIN